MMILTKMTADRRFIYRLSYDEYFYFILPAIATKSRHRQFIADITKS